MRARDWATFFLVLVTADATHSFLLKEMIEKKLQQRQAPVDQSVIIDQNNQRCDVLKNGQFYPIWEAYNDYWANLTNQILKQAGFPFPMIVAEPVYINISLVVAGTDITRDGHDCDYCKANFDVEIATCASMCEDRTLAVFEDFVNKTLAILGDVAMGEGGNPMSRLTTLGDVADSALSESMKIMAPCATCTFSPLNTYTQCFSGLAWDARVLLQNVVNRLGIGEFVDTPLKDAVSGTDWEPKMEELDNATAGQPWKWPSDGRRRRWAVRRRVYVPTSTDPFAEWPATALKNADQALIETKITNQTTEDREAKRKAIIATCHTSGKKLPVYTTHKGYLDEEEDDEEKDD